MKNTEYVVLPSPELIDQYVIASQIELLKGIKKEIREWYWLLDSYGNVISQNNVESIIDERISELQSKKKPDCRDCKFYDHELDEKVGTDVCYGCKDYNYYKLKGE